MKIDKIEISNIGIRFDDIDLLKNAGLYHESNIGYSIKIQNPTKSCSYLRAGVSTFTGVEWCKLQLGVDDPVTGNVDGWTIEEIKAELTKIKADMLEIFSIDIDISEAKVSKIEIQRTIQLDQSYWSYKRPITTFMASLPRSNHWIKYDSTFYVRSGIKRPGLSYIFYDKTDQARKKFGYVSENLARFEIELNEKSIEHNLGTNELSDMTDDIISAYYDNMLCKVKKNIMIEHKKTKKWIKEQIENERKNNCHWMVSLLRKVSNEEIISSRYIPKVLDVEQICEVIDEIDIPRKARIKESFRKDALRHEMYLRNRDDLKLLEILQKLTNANNVAIKKIA